MLRHPFQPARGCKITRAGPAPAATSTACRGTAADTSPDELSMLTDQLTDFRRSARVLRLLCSLEQVRSFVAGHVITTALTAGLLGAAVFFLSR